MEQVIRVGIAGFGKSGSVFHAPFLHVDKRFSLCKVYERAASKSKEKYPYVEVVRSFEELLTDDIDMVIVSTPNGMHYEMAKQAVSMGKNVVVEKPIAVTSRQVEELIEIAKEKGVLLSAYQNRRWDGGFITVKRIIESGMLGDIIDYEVHFDRYSLGKNRTAWSEINEPGSGVLYDLGTHLTDQVVYLFGMPKAVYADLRVQREGFTIIDNFQMYLYYEDKKVVVSAGRIVREKGPHIAIHGKNGSYVKYGMDPQEEILISGVLPGGPGWGLEPKNAWGVLNTEFKGVHFNGAVETEPGNYARYYDNIYKAIVGEDELVVKPEQSRDVLRILEAAMESSEKGCRILL